jgi:hypothetical protein
MSTQERLIQEIRNQPEPVRDDEVFLVPRQLTPPASPFALRNPLSPCAYLDNSFNNFTAAETNISSAPGFTRELIVS